MPEPILTAHSEYLPLHSVFLRPVAEAFGDTPKIAAQWEALNYLSAPDPEQAAQEYAGFESLVQKAAREVHPMAGGSDLSLDSLYCRDAAIATDFGMILCQMGKGARGGEPAFHGERYREMGLPVLGAITGPGTLEGGDVAWLDRQTLAVGHTYRTNREGIKQLKALLEPRGIEVIVAALPHFRGPSDVFHLMSILSPVDRDLAVVYSPLMPIAFRNELLARGFTLVEVPEAEYDSMGCNVLATAPRTCLMTGGNPLTEKALREAGCEVTTYPGREISIKGGGGPTCLTRPYMRIDTGQALR